MTRPFLLRRSGASPTATVSQSNGATAQGSIPTLARTRGALLSLCENPVVDEARLEDAGSGLAPVTEGWFVVNVRDAEWFSSETRGAACWFASEYGEPPIEFAQLGINVTVLEPGQSSVYHAEANQEAFLVLAARRPGARGSRVVRHARAGITRRARGRERPRGRNRLLHACRTRLYRFRQPDPA